jgi:hypothetical protein
MRSTSSNVAVDHLNTLKPLDGWSIQKDKNGTRLFRRNVPLTDNFFLDIHYDAVSKTVVGILTLPAAGGNGRSQAQVLVDRTGRPTGRTMQLTSVQNWRTNNSATTTSTPPPSTQSSSTSAETTTSHTFSDQQNKELLKYAVLFIGASILVKAMSQTLLVFYLLAFPLAYLYAVQNCPSSESFDAKKELKRVLRGEHLPDQHADKPKGFWEKMAARAVASVTTELVTLPGYEMEMWDFASAGWGVCVTVPTSNMNCYWIGALGKWHYITSREIVVAAEARRR